MSLSEKSLKVVGTEVPEVKEQIVYFEKDVKEFIKRLKEPLLKELEWLGEVTTDGGKKKVEEIENRLKEIDKLAGEELI